jgi:hypothetical protein
MADKLPETTFSVQSITERKEAVDAVDGLIQRNLEMEQIFEDLQPLLYELSVKLYADDNSTISLAKLIEDSVKWIKEQP